MLPIPRSLAVAVVLECAAWALRAQIVPVATTPTGGIVPCDPPGGVRMTSAEIDLHLAADRMEAKGVYVFVNPSARDVATAVGLPVMPGAELIAFRALIDGTESPEARSARAAPMIPPAPDPEDPSIPTSWVRWTMSFPPARERKVMAAYAVRPLARPHSHLTNAAEAVVQTTSERAYRYWTQMHRFWAGIPRETTVRVHISPRFRREWIREWCPPWPKAPGQPLPLWKRDASGVLDTLCIPPAKPDWRHDVLIRFRACTVAEEVEALVAALRAGRLDLAGREYLAAFYQTAAGEALGLSEEDRRARLFDVYAHGVPPLAPAPALEAAKASVLAHKDGSLVWQSFRHAFVRYRSSPQDLAKARALAPSYREFLRMVISAAEQINRELAGLQDTMRKQGAPPEIVGPFRDQLGLPETMLQSARSELAQVESFLGSSR